MNPTTTFQELTFKGCEDHIASCEFEKKRLIFRAKSWGMFEMIDRSKHISSTALTHIISNLSVVFV